LGDAVSGEGVMGLPYALYVAGNKNTILTLWSISDEVTVEFIKKGGAYSKPKYWAAFVLYGI